MLENSEFVVQNRGICLVLTIALVLSKGEGKAGTFRSKCSDKYICYYSNVRHVIISPQLTTFINKFLLDY